MPDYRVSWEIDIDAETPTEAAVKALIIQRDPESTANVFDVIKHDEDRTYVSAVEVTKVLSHAAALLDQLRNNSFEDGRWREVSGVLAEIADLEQVDRRQIDLGNGASVACEVCGAYAHPSKFIHKEGCIHG